MQGRCLAFDRCDQLNKAQVSALLRSGMETVKRQMTDNTAGAFAVFEANACHLRGSDFKKNEKISPLSDNITKLRAARVYS